MVAYHVNHCVERVHHLLLRATEFVNTTGLMDDQEAFSYQLPLIRISLEKIFETQGTYIEICLLQHFLINQFVIPK